MTNPEPRINNVYCRDIVVNINRSTNQVTVIWVRPIAGLEEPIIAEYTGVDGRVLLYHGNDQAVISDGSITVRNYAMGMTVTKEIGRFNRTNLLVKIRDLIPEEVNLE